jgi:hypothetical protein
MPAGTPYMHRECLETAAAGIGRQSALMPLAELRHNHAINFGAGVP